MTRIKNCCRYGLATAAAVAMLAVPLSSVAMVPANIAQAAAVDEIQEGFDEAGGSENDTDLTGIVKTVIDTMLFIVGVLAVIMIIFSGIRYITAHGDKGQVESAKNTLIFSIVGLVVAIVAYAVVGWVIGLFNSSGGSSA